MKKLLFLLLIGHATVYAQTSPDRNSFQLGVDYLKLDAPDDMGLHPTLRYARHFANNRFVVAATGGYYTTSSRQSITGKHTVADNYRARLTADLSVLVDLLRSNRHAFRLGGGPSAWYRYDDLLRSRRYTLNSATGEVILASAQRDRVSAINIGWHLAGEYAYSLASGLTANGRVMVVNLGPGGVVPMAGLGLSFHF